MSEGSITEKKRYILDVSTIPLAEMQRLAGLEDIERRAKIMSKAVEFSTTSTGCSAEEEAQKKAIKNIVKMTLWEEFCACMLFLFGVPGAAVSIPAAIIALGLCIGFTRSIFIFVLIMLPLAIQPVPFDKNSSTSWAAVQIVRYFSFKVIFSQQQRPGRPTILVAPPHGVFPFGNIVTIIAYPSIVGFPVHGLTASAALATPIFRQILGTLGLVDASAKSALSILNQNGTIGISTGGVAEVFETNTPTGDEVIILKSRKGIVRLAFRAGADLVPCYLFGNTKLLSLFTGGSGLHNFFKVLSRKIGFALIAFWGRFALPIPYRIPILGVMDEAIQVPKKENPTDEEVDAIHQLLIERMMNLFESHKHLYGWSHKKLIIV